MGVLLLSNQSRIPALASDRATMTERTVSLERHQRLAADARAAALRIIPEVVEQNAPPGSVPSEE
jgi:hypothetical protein